MLLLHPLFENVIVDQSVDEDCNLNIFEMIANTYEPMKKLVSRNFWFLQGFRWILETLNIIFNGGRNMNLCFL